MNVLLLVGGAALAATPGDVLLSALQGGPSAAALAVPPGYRAKIVATGFTLPTSLAVDTDGRIYVVEGGYSTRAAWASPRLLEVKADGTSQPVALGAEAPWTGVDARDGEVVVAEGGMKEGGSLLRVGADGAVTPLVQDLPGRGENATGGVVIGADGWVYFGQGTATNAGYVGNESLESEDPVGGWLARRPEYHDIPCATVTLEGERFTAPNLLTEETGDEATTSAFAPFGVAIPAGEPVEGALPCTGAIMRVPLTGGALELVAWGLRAPVGLAFGPEERLFATDQGYTEAGPRPVFGAGDALWDVRPGAWYGWPDYAGGEPLVGSHFERPDLAPLRRVLRDPPGEPPVPAALFAAKAAASGLDFPKDDRFGFAGQGFVAEAAGGAREGRVVTVDPSTGVITPFVTNRPAAREGRGLAHPVDVAFDSSGRHLYVLDAGPAVVGADGAPRPSGAGVLWRIDRTAEWELHVK